MKKIVFIIFVTSLCVPGYNQQTSLSNFLDRDLTQILHNHIDSLNYELHSTREELMYQKIKYSSINSAASASIAFLLLLSRLENNLPLNETDSLMINFDTSHQPAIIIAVDRYAFDLLMTNDSSYINYFPKLAKMMKEEKLVIEPGPARSRLSAPEIEIPPAPSSTGNNKQSIAQAWLKYIYDLSNECKEAQSQLDFYIKKEKAKVPDGNLNNIIKLRQKFAVFIIENYCKK